MFLISTYVDGPYWVSSLEPLLYPTGCSFYRVFSYREDYVYPKTFLETLIDEDQSAAFLADSARNDGLFGLRFKNTEEIEYRGMFIPLRQVTLTTIIPSDTLQIQFRLGNYVDFNADRKFRSISLDGIIDSSRPENLLLLEVSKSLKSNLTFSAELPKLFWEKLGEDTAFSRHARENFKGTVTLRVVSVHERGKKESLLPESIEEKGRIRTFGFKFRSGKVYDIQLAINRSITQDISDVHAPFEYLLKAPANHYLVSKDRLAVSGNYRVENVWLQPIVSEPAPVALEWLPVKKGEEGILADPNRDKILPSSTLILAVSKFWNKARIIDALLSLAFLIVATFFFYKASVMNLQDKALVAAGAAAAALFANFIKDFIKGR
jgi:hypothetical protein